MQRGLCKGGTGQAAPEFAVTVPASGHGVAEEPGCSAQDIRGFLDDPVTVQCRHTYSCLCLKWSTRDPVPQGAKRSHLCPAQTADR